MFPPTQKDAFALNVNNLKIEMKKEKVDLQAECKQHFERKEKARMKKTSNKECAISDPLFHAATADVQSVMTTPYSNAFTLYYARKLNFTGYNEANNDRVYVKWDETKRHRGVNEIVSILYLYLRE